MKKDITLIILAGGMGSRFGGLKQIEPMGPNGEFIIDYSIFDAVKVGFNKVVFLIKEEIFDTFKETIGKRIEPYVNVEYVFQKFDTIPTDIMIPTERLKPLGTAHAVLCTKDIIKEPFAMINADDFYGRDAFKRAYDYLNNVDENSNNYAMIGYKAANTLTENGSVKRGICEVDENDYLISITESKVEIKDDIIVATPLSGEKEFVVKEHDTVAMNFLLFTPTIFKYLEDNFNLFLKNSNDLLTSEYLIPDVLTNLIKQKIVSTKVINTDATWYGVTYKEDTPKVKNAIKNLIEDGVYNSNLWK